MKKINLKKRKKKRIRQREKGEGRIRNGRVQKVWKKGIWTGYEKGIHVHTYNIHTYACVCTHTHITWQLLLLLNIIIPLMVL